MNEWMNEWISKTEFSNLKSALSNQHLTMKQTMSHAPGQPAIDGLVAINNLKLKILA